MTAADWRLARVSPDGTHHVVDGMPAYALRYREVGKYHEPGLAPAVDDLGATHIDALGHPAYGPRFVRTFGFYEGRAAVHGTDGWHHVLPDGSPLDSQRYGWCGNYQGGRCAVRDAAGWYMHLLPDGRPAYTTRWRYAGDYRDGIAVVQAGDGRHTHVDQAGALVHGRWFEDLDVFHKGFARARDDLGWVHVVPRGEPAYARRFAAIEPFYNGQARVERFDGALEVVDECGATVLELRPTVHAEPAEGEILARTAWGRVRRVEPPDGPAYVTKWTRGSNDREVEALLAVRGHPSVPPLLGRQRADMNDRLTLGLCPGEVVGQPRSLPARSEAEAARITREVLNACAALHEAGWVHTDIHPANVLAGHPATLLDFACAVRATSDRPWRGEINWGVWEYVPHEMLADYGSIDPSADVYSAACLCLAMVRGAPPFRVAVQRHFDAGGWPAVRAAFLQARATQRWTGVSDALARALAPALSLEPHARPTARRLAEALADV